MIEPEQQEIPRRQYPALQLTRKARGRPKGKRSWNFNLTKSVDEASTSTISEPLADLMLLAGPVPVSFLIDLNKV